MNQDNAGVQSQLADSLINGAGDCAKTRTHWGFFCALHVQLFPFLRSTGWISPPRLLLLITRTLTWISRAVSRTGCLFCDGGSGGGWELRQRVSGQLWPRGCSSGSRWLSFRAHPSRGGGLQLGNRTDDGGTWAAAGAPGVRGEAVPEPGEPQPSEGDSEAAAALLQDRLPPGDPSRRHRAGHQERPQQIRYYSHFIIIMMIILISIFIIIVIYIYIIIRGSNFYLFLMMCHTKSRNTVINDSRRTDRYHVLTHWNTHWVRRKSNIMC